MKTLIQILHKIEKLELKRIEEIHSFTKNSFVISLSGNNTGHTGRVLGFSRKGGSLLVEFKNKISRYSLNTNIKENISYLKKINEQELKVQFLSFMRNPDKIEIAINGKKYEGYCKEIFYKNFRKILQKSSGKALSYLKKYCELKEV